jgi:hypothetical protein
VLDGRGHGSVLTLRAPRIRVVGLHVVGVGPDGDLYEPDAAVRLVDCDGCVSSWCVPANATTASARRCGSRTRTTFAVTNLIAIGSGAGPGVTAFAGPRPAPRAARLEGFLDGLYLERSDEPRADRTHASSTRGRYGVHLMFNRGALVERVAPQGGGVGSAIMYGRDTVRDVTLRGHGGAMAFGLLLQEERDARIERAELRGNTIGLLAVAAPGLGVRGRELRRQRFRRACCSGSRRPSTASTRTRDRTLDQRELLRAQRLRRRARRRPSRRAPARQRLRSRPPLDLDRRRHAWTTPHVAGIVARGAGGAAARRLAARVRPGHACSGRRSRRAFRARVSGC